MKKILVVDDSPVDLKNIEKIISDAGAFVITASNGNEALAKAKQNKPELVFMDVNMPELDGYSAARQLAADPETKGIPVVFVTSKDQKADRVFAKMLGAKGFVTKPYAAADIVAML
jgi:twitching motility two-component system response regulator PilH